MKTTKLIAGMLIAGQVSFLLLIMPDGCFANYLHWCGSEARLKELEFWLKQTDWFIKPYSLDDFFDNPGSTVVLQINPKRLCYVAMLLCILKDVGLIDSFRGKGYLERVAEKTRYYGKQPVAKRFSRMIWAITKDPLSYSNIIMPALKMVCRVMEK